MKTRIIGILAIVLGFGWLANVAQAQSVDMGKLTCGDLLEADDESGSFILFSDLYRRCMGTMCNVSGYIGVQRK